MPTRQSKTGNGAGTALVEAPNAERERVFDLYRQWGYLEADLDPLGFLQLSMMQSQLHTRIPVRLIPHSLNVSAICQVNISNLDKDNFSSNTMLVMSCTPYMG